MSSSAALYYLWLDIYDTGWLRSSLLYWDRIYTLVPSGYESRVSPDTEAVADEGWLLAWSISSDDQVVYRAMGDVADQFHETFSWVKVLRNAPRSMSTDPLPPSGACKQ
jgi:hypothetical protein